MHSAINRATPDADATRTVLVLRGKPRGFKKKRKGTLPKALAVASGRDWIVFGVHHRAGKKRWLSKGTRRRRSLTERIYAELDMSEREREARLSSHARCTLAAAWSPPFCPCSPTGANDFLFRRWKPTVTPFCRARARLLLRAGAGNTCRTHRVSFGAQKGWE